VGQLPKAFYLRDGDQRYVPTEATTSPWDPDAQHGGPPAALAAHCIDQESGTGGRRLARIAVDFLGAIPRRPMDVAVTVVRPGRRVQLTDATLSVDGRVVVMARAWHIATSPGSPAPALEPPPDPVPPEQPQLYFAGLTDWGYGEAIDWRFTRGGFAETGPATVWTRLRIPFLDGQPTTGLQRALVVADAANGLSGELPLEDWWFIPPGIVVTMLRAPFGEWVQLTARTRRAADGIGVASGHLADQDGYVGEVAQPLMIALRS
jgi:acyl-CoA thioesterase superfamily protein/acyl-Coa thioesterase superfamily protein